MMFWRSVVGKLWFTILLLVSVVLLVLTVLLLEYFERFHTEQAESELTDHAALLVTFLETETTGNGALEMSETISATYASNAVLIGEDNYWYTANRDEHNLPIDLFFEEPEFQEVTEDRETIVTQGNYAVTEEASEIMIVGMPVTFSDGEEGSLFLYQPLDVIEEATSQTKQIVFLSAGVAIILTTIFAFFLSSRITAPLRQMRQASLEAAHGNFDTKIPIQTKDEIGLLAMAFNRMGRAIQTNIQAVNEEKEQLSRILSSMADGVLTINRNRELIVTNPPADTFLEAFRFESKESETNLPPVLEELFKEVLNRGEEVVSETTVQGRTWVILMTPLYGENVIRGAVAVLRDMTEERQHDKLRKDFIANVSHELRTPISMLQGYSEAIVDGIAETEAEKKEMAGIIYDESLRIGRLVNELLDLARMEAGYLSLHREEIHLGEFTEKMVRKFQVVAKEQDVNLHYDLETPERAVFYADADRLEQVATNLIDNAIRHTGEDGDIYFRVRLIDSELLLEVEDTGAGIPEEDLPFIFERFYKADKARTRGRAGTGLGLAIVKNIIDAHGGTVAAHSHHGEGTTFQVRLPEYKEERK
ncbi:ATP-binding protein [Alkalicoccus urumqiensis]|uniref:histidine kinase n=1 Tax=Alkalicoccus urumqiensis TaxID=1548213 RepID=A0A2P6MKI3_ALKUR|nr:ATP-binding protein [Alkalicoccus urumqiensis]PRO66778.1 PAS domain-containing sensor histidine kinase [Alkalicoccus urumqiensis]